MKYLKTFENIDDSRPIYKAGDYVYINPAYNKPRAGKLIDDANTTFFAYEQINGEISVTIKHRIVRRLTPEEIEYFDLELAKNKYNL